MLQLSRDISDSLACEIVRAHHGELMLDAGLEGETSFTVSLPML